MMFDNEIDWVNIYKAEQHLVPRGSYLGDQEVD